MNNAINWFEIPAADFQRAVKFYNKVMAKPLKEEDFNGMRHAMFDFDYKKGIGGAVVKMEQLEPSADGSCVYLNVEGYLDEALKRATEAGGKVIMPKMGIGENGFIGLILDSEGNRVGFHSMS